MDESILHIQLLGGFRLSFDGQPNRGIDTPRLQSLLAYLLLHRSVPLTRQKVAFEFWPHTSENQARANLRHLLHTLRSDWPDANRYVQMDGQRLGWNLEAPLVLDVAEFERACDEGDWQQAVDLYRGDLLPGFYDDWVLVERERLSLAFREVLGCLAESLQAAGQYAEAIRVCMRLARRDPLREETYRMLMRLYAAQGEPAGVVQAYETCVEVLSRELGLSPAAETQAEFLRCSRVGPVHPIHPASVQDNLPAALDRMIGRAQEKEQIKRLVLDHRLVTLTGFGGVGKTRLALDVAHQSRNDFPAGVWWLDLAPLSDPALIPQAAVSIFNVRELADCQLVECLVDFLHHKRALLVIDNCEHLLEAAAQFTLRLLQGCPELHILTSSRVSLRLTGEKVYPIPPLAVPTEMYGNTAGTSAAGDLTLSESEQLFLARATAILPAFGITSQNRASVAQICRRLNGIPLAIELAAVRVKSLAAEQIACRLDDALTLLRHANPAGLPRHQTLQATLDWSHTLLSLPEQQLLRRLAVFTSSFVLEAVEAVAGSGLDTSGLDTTPVLELLSHLVEHSLVAVDVTGDEARYRLHEVTRQYAGEKLVQAGELEQAQLAALDYYCCLAETAEPQLRGGQQLPWFHRLDLETDNLRSVLRWATRQQQPDPGALALRLVAALWLYWFIRGRFVEGMHWTEKALAMPTAPGEPPGARGRALYTAASFSFFMGHFGEAAEFSQASLAACQAAQDRYGEVISLHHLGLLEARAGAVKQARDFLQAGLDQARLSGDDWLISLLLDDLGNRAWQQEQWAEADHLFQESLTFARRTGDRFLTYYALNNLADVAMRQGNRAQAVVFNRQAMLLCRETGDLRGEANCLAVEADWSAMEGAYNRARELRRESLAIYWEMRDRGSTLTELEKLAMAACSMGLAEQAVQLLAACHSIRGLVGVDAFPFERAEVEAYLERLRAELEPSTFTTAWTAGQLMDLEEAVDWALQD